MSKSEPSSTPATLARGAATVAALTILSRILGFVRDILIAAALGAGPVADAFVVALRIPTLMRRFLAEGAFNTAFVPLYEEAERRGGGERFAGEVFSFVAAAALLLTAVGLAAMPLIVSAITPGLSREGGSFDLAVELSRTTFPFCLSTALSVVAAAILSAHGRFVAASLAPALLNTVLLAALLGLAALGAHGAAAARFLAFALLAGSIAQCALVLAAFARVGPTLRLRWPRLTPDMRRFLALAGPGLLAASITQVNAVVALVVASGATGAVTWLYYADRVYQLPLGIIVSAIGIALLPAISRASIEGDAAARRRQLSRAVEAALFLALPAAAALVLAGQDIAAALFGRGAFSLADASATGAALAVLALGLPGFVAARLLQTLFFARAEMRPPFLVALLGIAADLATSLLLFPAWGHLAVATGSVASAWINAILLGAMARRAGLLSLDHQALRRIPRMIGATIAMAAALGLIGWASGGEAPLARLLALTLGGLISYGLAAIMLGALDLAAVASSFDRGRKGLP